MNKSSEPAILPQFRKPLLVGAVLIASAGLWWYYGRTTTFDPSDHPNWIKGTLAIPQANRVATARLHNNREGWVVEQVMLYVWSGKAKPCKKNTPGCGLDEAVDDVSLDDAEEKGLYRCNMTAPALPSATFECSFTYPYGVGWGRRYGWTVGEVVARRVNPLGI
jgi:hypothetical protein